MAETDYLPYYPITNTQANNASVVNANYKAISDRIASAASSIGQNIDGGGATSVYLPSQVVDGGNA